MALLPITAFGTPGARLDPRSKRRPKLQTLNGNEALGYYSDYTIWLNGDGYNPNRDR